MKKLFLFLLVCCSPAFAKAYDFEYDMLFYNITQGYEVEVTCQSYGTDNYAGITQPQIPEEVYYDGYTYTVTRIGERAFANCESLLEVLIPNSVKSIGEGAFYDCYSLWSFTIPDGIESIEKESFAGCSSMNYVTIPNTVKSIGNGAFSGCCSLTSINIPNSVKNIGEGAFPTKRNNCYESSLEEITVDKNNPNYSDINGILYNKDQSKLLFIPSANKSTSITLPLSYTSTDLYDIRELDYLENIFVEEGHEYYCSIDGVLYNKDKTKLISCPRKKSSITIQNSVTTIEEYAFEQCSSLTNITIPNSVTSIGGSAFSGCSSLNNITIPNSVTNIEHGTFSDCSSLSDITIPNSVRSIGDNAFSYCSSLSDITIPNSVTSIGLGAFTYTPFYDKFPDGLVYINNLLYCYKNQKNQLYEVEIKDGTVTICDGAFSNCSNLTSVTIPNSVTSIGKETFFYCYSLDNVTIPNSVTSIGELAFAGCSSLGNITIPNSVTSIGGNAFSGCSSLNNITIPNSVTNIEHGTFSGCSSLSDITIPNSVTSIGELAFADCSSLSDITIPNSVTSIGGGVFEGCSSLTDITIPEKITTIGQYVFSGCSSLTTINWDATNCSDVNYNEDNYPFRSPFYDIRSNIKKFILGDKVENIPAFLCYEMENISPLKIPTTIKTIGKEALYNVPIDSELATDGVIYAGPILLGYDKDKFKNTSIRVKEGTNAMLEKAFYDCTSLVSITFPETITKISDEAFRGCSSLTDITIPNSVTSIGELAFADCSSISTITIPNSVTNFGEKCFSGCSSLNNITIPNGVTTIGFGAFASCSSLVSITIPNSVTSIGENVFMNCDNLTAITVDKENSSYSSLNGVLFDKDQRMTLHVPQKIKGHVIFPNTITSIKQSDISYRNLITSVYLGNNIEWIDDDAFIGCSSLSKVIWNITTYNDIGSYYEGYSSPFENTGSQFANLIIGDDVEYVPANLTERMDNLSSITYGKNIVNMGYHVVSSDSIIWNTIKCIGKPDCNSVESFVFGDNVESIPASLCESMTKLKLLSLPKSIKSIGNNAFANIPGLVLYCQGEMPATIGTNVVNDASQCFVVPNAATYKSAWPKYKDYIFDMQDVEREESVVANSVKSNLQQTIGLSQLNHVVKLKLSGTINSYDIMMIRNQMPFLRELDLSEASIVANSYEYASGYNSIKDTLTPQAFTGANTKIIKLILPKSLKYIDKDIVNSYLDEITILGGKIANNAFENSNIRRAILSDNTVEVASSAFKNCDKLKEIVLGDGVQSIGSAAFYDCDKLSTVSLSNTIRKIDQDAFYGCTALHTITLPDNLDTIGNYAFQGAGLYSITIPANVSYMGAGAFAGMKYSSAWGNTDLQYYPSVTATSQTTYYATSSATSNSSTRQFCLSGSLREVTIPKDSKLTTIPSRAFEGNNSLSKLNLLGESITTIDEIAFHYCALDTVILPPNLTSLSTLSFGRCTELKFVAMPNSITSIAPNAFVGCTNLNDIQFSSKLTHIGHHAFADCTNLSNVDVPGLVTSIGDHAFKDCNVNNIYSYLFDPFTIGQNTFSPYTYGNATLYIPNVEDTEMKYIYDTQWSQFLKRIRMDNTFEYRDFYATGDVVIGQNDESLQGNPNAELNSGSGLIIEEGENAQNLGTITLSANEGDWASLIVGCNTNVDTLQLLFSVQGHKWHFLGFPFPIKIADIQSDYQFAIFEYDGALRAAKDTTGWKSVPTSQQSLEAGQGYIIQFNTPSTCEFTIKLTQPDFCKMVNQMSLKVYPSDKTRNQNWNYVSNPYFAYYDIRDLNYTGPITVWDVQTGTYQSFRAGDDEYILSPYEAFFLQNTDETGQFNLVFDKSKCMTKQQSEQKLSNRIAAKQYIAEELSRSVVNIAISDGIYTDATRVVINEDASLLYEVGVDAAKFMSTERVPQLFSYDVEQDMCAINERPMGNGTINLGIKLPKSGNYFFSCTRMDTTLYLLDKEERITHDFATGDYHFNAKAGTNSSRFALIRTRQDISTGMDNITNLSIEVCEGGIYVHGEAFVQIYNMTGVLMMEGNMSGHVALPTGVYMILNNGVTTKYVIR